MSHVGKGYDINQTFIIESAVDAEPIFSACTALYTTNILSCSGNTSIFLGNGVINFGGSLYTNNDLSANTISATTFYGDGSNLTGVLTQDTFVTGGTYNNGTAVFTNNTGGTFNVTGFYAGASDVFVTGATYNNNTFTFTNNTGSTFDVLFDVVTGLTINGGLTATTFSATTYQNLPTDIRVTGATYSNNTFTYTNNTGGTFNVLFNTVTGLTVNGNLIVTGNTSLQGLTATTISATTYQNLPVDIRVTGGTKSGSVITFTNNTGGTFTVTGITDTFVTGGTYNSGTSIITFVNNTGGTFTVTGIAAGGGGAGPISVSGTSLYSNNPATSNFSTSDSIFFGANAGSGATNASYSNFLGQDAGYQATGASFSNFFGRTAGYQATSATRSNFLGWTAGYQASGASYSNFLGVSAGYRASGASYSNFFGSDAGDTARNANNSNFFGQTAGLQATNASQSNFFGTSAGYSAINANNSNFFGFETGYQASNASFSNLFGFNVGKTFAGNNLGSNNIIIGTNISLPSGATDSINIGGVLFGINTYSTTGGTSSIIPQASGRIGIGVVTPQETLHVSGNTRIQGGLTATTISATTYQNLPTDIRVTGGTYNSGTSIITFRNNTGGTFTVTGITAGGGGGGVSGDYLPLSGGTVTGGTRFTSGLTGNTGVFSSSTQNVLNVVGSGSTSPIFRVQGSQGELFAVTDSLTGSLFSVNDISGLPIMEVFSDNTILMGSYFAPSLNTTYRLIVNSGSTNLYSIPVSAYTGAFYDYTVSDASNARAGNIMAIFSGTSVQYTETSTLDIGSTTGVTFSVAISSGNAVLSVSATTNNWSVKTIIRSI